MQNFEKLKVNFTPESIYKKKKCGLKKHTDIYSYMYIYTYISYIYIYIMYSLSNSRKEVFYS